MSSDPEVPTPESELDPAIPPLAASSVTDDDLGTHESMSAQTYHRKLAVSSSLLATLAATSPKVADYERRHRKPPTPAMLFGTLVHTLVFEPDLLDAQWMFRPKIPRRKNSDKQQWADWQQEARESGREFMTEDLLPKARKCADAIRKHPVAGVWLEDLTHREFSNFWKDSETGLFCKARLDGAMAGWGSDWIVDLKVTGSTERGFQSTVFGDDGFNYGLRAGFYCRAADAIDWSVTEFRWITADPEPPHEVVTYRARDDALAWCRERAAKYLRIWAECEKQGVFPGRNDDRAIELTVPRWAVGKELVSDY